MRGDSEEGQDVAAGHAGMGASLATDLAGAVGGAAAEALGGARGRAFRAMLAEGGVKDLAVALPIWASVAGLEAGRFRALVVGPGFGVGAAALLQRAACAVADVEHCGPERVADAGAAIAAAFEGMREASWGYALNYAADKAAYAAQTAGVASGVDVPSMRGAGAQSN